MKMSKRLLAGVAGLAALGLAGSAMANQEEVQTATTESTITIAPTASIWTGDATVQLTLDGTGAENYALKGSLLTHLNNTAAQISVAVENGAAAVDLPADLQYWLFRGLTDGAALTALQNNEVTDFASGVFRFSGADVNTGVGTTLFANVAISGDNVDGDDLLVVYAADARASLPPVNDHVTVVTWTIAANP